MPDFIDNVEEDVAEFLDYQPKQGGLIDRHRKERARREEAQREQENIDAGIEQPSYKAVKVAPQSPEVISPSTITIQPGGYAPVLPLSKYRYRAVLLVATAGASAVLCKDVGSAISGNGFTLPYGIPFPTFTRAQVYAYNNTGAILQVSVFPEIYAPEAS